ncbi:unnamed protein product [Urochloa humidicola]
MARSQSSLFRPLLPCHFFFLPVLAVTFLVDAVVLSNPNNHQSTRLVLPDRADAFKLLSLQDNSSAPARGNMVIFFNAGPSPGSCGTIRCKKVCSSSTTTPTLLQSVASDHGASKPYPILRYFCSSSSMLPENFLAGNFEVGCPACWLERRQCSSPLQCVWGPPLHHYCEASFSSGRWTRVSRKSTSVGCAGIRVGHASGCNQNFGGEYLKVDKGIQGTSISFLMFCTLFVSKHRSGSASLNVRADLRLQSMLVLRFNEERSKTNCLSPVKATPYLRFKLLYPRRHRPVRQPRGASAVLSECNKEDLRCFWRGHLSSTAQRPRQRHHLCLLCEKCRIPVSRLSCIPENELFYLSLCYDSPVVAQKLHLYLGWKIPPLCTLALSV